MKSRKEHTHLNLGLGVFGFDPLHDLLAGGGVQVGEGLGI